jgi:hypothetical protein
MSTYNTINDNLDHFLKDVKSAFVYSTTQKDKLNLTTFFILSEFSTYRKSFKVDTIFKNSEQVFGYLPRKMPLYVGSGAWSSVQIDLRQ